MVINYTIVFSLKRCWLCGIMVDGHIVLIRVEQQHIIMSTSNTLCDRRLPFMDVLS